MVQHIIKSQSIYRYYHTIYIVFGRCFIKFNAIFFECNAIQIQCVNVSYSKYIKKIQEEEGIYIYIVYTVYCDTFCNILSSRGGNESFITAVAFVGDEDFLYIL